jgi:hypothetical protein
LTPDSYEHIFGLSDGSTNRKMGNVELKLPPKQTTIDSIALEFLRFKHEHEAWWEGGELLTIAIVFGLEILHRDSLSHFAGTLSHVLVAVLLIAKVISLVAHKLSVRFKSQV